jgi:hypothetical protein
MTAAARLAVDIGGTFTDLALEHLGGLTTAKVLTTPEAPERAVMTGVDPRGAGPGCSLPTSPSSFTAPRSPPMP